MWGKSWSSFGGTQRATNEDRFWKLVDRSGDCWEWIGVLNKDGYGVFNTETESGWKTYYAHRYSFFLKHGRHCEGQVNHHCDNRKCVNPEHFYEGDQIENMRDARVRGRIGAGAAMRCRAQLMREVGFTQREIGEILGVHQVTISKWEKAWQPDPSAN